MTLRAGDGSGRTVGDCIRDMIVVSDNRCGAWGLRQVGCGPLDSRLAREGFPGTSLASPQRTTAADVARFFDAGPGRDAARARRREAATAELYGLLRPQQVNDRLPLGLPPGTPIAHKTGDRQHWAHDAGIITHAGGRAAAGGAQRAVARSLLRRRPPGPGRGEAFGAIADLARALYAAAP